MLIFIAEIISISGYTHSTESKNTQTFMDEIKIKEHLTASIGIGPNKLITKIASDRQKPDGLTIVREEEAEQFLEPLNLRVIPGVGPKTALELIKRFGTVKIMYEQINEDPKLEAKFGAFKKEAELSEELVTLERHAPIVIPPIEELAPGSDTDAPAKYFEKMGFATLLKRLLFPEAERTISVRKPKERTKPNDAQASLF